MYFLIKQNLTISGEKMLMSGELKGSVTSFIYFLDLIQIRYNRARFHNCTTQEVGRGGEFALLPSASIPQKAHPEQGYILGYQGISIYQKISKLQILIDQWPQSSYQMRNCLIIAKHFWKTEIKFFEQCDVFHENQSQSQKFRQRLSLETFFCL